jgi:hypothetical protein
METFIKEIRKRMILLLTSSIPDLIPRSKGIAQLFNLILDQSLFMAEDFRHEACSHGRLRIFLKISSYETEQDATLANL